MVNLDRLVEIYDDAEAQAIHEGKSYLLAEKLALLAVYDYGWSDGYNRDMVDE